MFWRSSHQVPNLCTGEARRRRATFPAMDRVLYHRESEPYMLKAYLRKNEVFLFSPSLITSPKRQACPPIPYFVQLSSSSMEIIKLLVCCQFRASWRLSRTTLLPRAHTCETPTMNEAIKKLYIFVDLCYAGCTWRRITFKLKQNFGDKNVSNIR